MKIAIGSDHAGFLYKSKLIGYLEKAGHKVKDFGTDSEDAVDYPEFIRPVAKAVSAGNFERGIVLGGSGNGEAMVANREKGIRCALCWNNESAVLARKHNDANMISLGQRMMDEKTAIEIVRLWLETPFEGGRHIPRIRKIDAGDVPCCPAAPLEEAGNDSDDFSVVISFGYILYSEGKNTIEITVDPGLKGPTVIHVPSPENWNKDTPEWAHGRRDEILNRIKTKCMHLIYEISED